MHSIKRVAAAFTFAGFLVGNAVADPMNVFGTFQTADGGAHITIKDCGDGSPCGAISWINPAELQAGETAATLKDAKGSLLMGLPMLKGFSKTKTEWRGGTIYDPEAGKTYASRMKRLGDGRLQVKGCIGPICQTQVWTAAASK
jgi:uncharacterized protein (DUF2147 family)